MKFLFLSCNMYSPSNKLFPMFLFVCIPEYLIFKFVSM
uniref:Uncharacterized protein n=1 Tax=viral metagenome TaxID=1070528 RepID=A0A6C0H5N9_9ZZZZ